MDSVLHLRLLHIGGIQSMECEGEDDVEDGDFLSDFEEEQHRKPIL